MTAPNKDSETTDFVVDVGELATYASGTRFMVRSPESGRIVTWRVESAFSGESGGSISLRPELEGAQLWDLTWRTAKTLDEVRYLKAVGAPVPWAFDLHSPAGHAVQRTIDSSLGFDTLLERLCNRMVVDVGSYCLATGRRLEEVKTSEGETR